jgi:hypothetical protein
MLFVILTLIHSDGAGWVSSGKFGQVQRIRRCSKAIDSGIAALKSLMYLRHSHTWLL